MENDIKKEIGYEDADKRTRVSLEKTALGLVLFFIINPLVFMLIRWAMNEYSFVLTYMQIFNKFLLFFGALVFLKYFWLVTEKKPARIKEILHNHAPVTILLLFGLLMIVTTILNGASELSLYGDSYRGEGLFGFLSYIIYFLLTVFLLPDKYKKIVVKVLLATSAIIGCVIFADYVFFDAKYNFANKSGMILSNSNHLAYYLVVAAMFHGMMFVTAKKRGIIILYLCGFVLLTATLIMNNTLGSQIALFVGVLFAMVVYSVGKGKFQPVTIVHLVSALVGNTMYYTAPFFFISLGLGYVMEEKE